MPPSFSRRGGMRSMTGWLCGPTPGTCPIIPQRARRLFTGLISASLDPRHYCPAKSFATLKHFSFKASSSLFQDSRKAVTPSVSSSWVMASRLMPRAFN